MPSHTAHPPVPDRQRAALIASGQMWERVVAYGHDTISHKTERLIVPGGWLYRVTYEGVSVSITFVPEAI